MWKTAANRLRRALGRFDDWCRKHRHDPVPAQRETLGKMLNGHYQYYGITGNIRSLQRLHYLVQRVWHKWLSRRSWKAPKNWDWMNALLTRLPLPRPRIVHSWFTRAANP
jgi:hypothetical protein